MKRPPLLRAAFEGELVVDNFAGGGGASTGIEAAIGRPVDIAINHDAEAIAMHRANHPETRHYQENILEVDPAAACAGRPVGLAWFSPDCKHFSRAKGAALRDSGIRGLAWVVIRWARTVQPRVIVLENVEEFTTWGPLTEDQRPDPTRAGETFREWLGELTGCGYSVEFRSLVAADYGAPTTRRRLFLIARRDGRRAAWPEPTHGPGRAQAWRSAAEIIDWSLPCPSIFGRRKPLAEATLKRIARGLERYVFGSARPFIVPLTHQGDQRVHGIGEPVRTITGANRGELALVEPYLVRTAHGDVDKNGKRRGRGEHGVEAPLPTVLASSDFAVVEPFIVRHGHYSTRTGAGIEEGCGAGTFRGQRLSAPLATVCATNDKHLVAPVVIKHYGGVVGHRVDRPIGTITAQDHHSIAAGFLLKYHGGGEFRGQDPGEPLRTVDASRRFAEVRAFLVKYYGAEAQTQDLFEPLHTVTSKARFGLVVVEGEPYQLVDIGMRMLQPPELFGAQGFPEDYEIEPEHNGRPLTKTAQIRLAGNSVSPPNARAIVAANMGDEEVRCAS